MVFEVKDIVYKYADGSPALDGVSFRAKAGEKMAILGANGSGKSTLLHILNGLYFPVSGSVHAFGRPLTEESLHDMSLAKEFRRCVGFVFQNPDIQLFSSTVWDEVAFGPLQLGLTDSEVDQRVNDVLEMLNLKKVANRHPYNLSGGEKKKVAIASVLACNPDVLLLDEPTAGLDPKTQAWVVDCIVGLNQAGKTIITATHDLGTVQETADRIYILGEEHKVIAEGNPAGLLQDEELLIRGNLTHYHVHRHGLLTHAHAHRHLAHDHHEPHDA